MEIDWGEAWQISAVGFGTVFLVLVGLALVIWLTGLLTRKLDAG